MTKPSLLRSFPIVIASLMLLAAHGTVAAEMDGVANDFFENKIRPVLVRHCYECHSVESGDVKGGLVLDTRAGIRAGGDSGPAVVPKDVDQSLLIGALRHETFEMPPSGRLPAEVIEDFITWIRGGAPDPRDGEAVTVRPTIDLAEGRQFWAFQPPRPSALPAVRDTAWPKHESDYFILARLEAEGLQPAPLAGKRDLIRRATFDLLGLPPTPEEIQAFLADDSDQAFARVVDRLLESPHYGERWARYWLDVARYAEDQAHTFAVKPNDSGYRYRDWTIDAFNNDLPYDRFVRLQIAADLFVTDEAERFRHLPALGFVGLGAQYYKNSDAARARADELDDRVDTLTRGFLGLTVSCARCHDHKYDPIPTQDYYSLAGVFESCRLANLPLESQEVVDRYDAGQQKLKACEAELQGFSRAEKARLAETRVSEIHRYMAAVWSHRRTEREKANESLGDAAKAAGLDPVALGRWAKFLDANPSGSKFTALKGWNEQSPEQSAEAVAETAGQFERHVRALLAVRDGTASDEDRKLLGGTDRANARFVSRIIRKGNPAAEIDIDIRGAKELYLIVTNGGDGNGCDWADWAEPQLKGPDGDLKLTELDWKRTSTSTGGIQRNRNYGGRPIQIAAKEVAWGLGTHAPSTIIFDLPDGYTRFQARGGLDDGGTGQAGCGDKASVQFLVFTEQPSPRDLAQLAGSDGGLDKSQAELLQALFDEKGVFAVSDDEFRKQLSDEQKLQLEKLESDVKQAREAAPPMYAVAHGLAEATPKNMNVFLRGNPAQPGEQAPRRFLRVLAGDEPAAFQQGSGRRELAEAIASRENPLTARVMVNRIWQYHFGRGLVGTPSNFGQIGERPTHPELLDYLAHRFVESGWSVKQLHREIMLSTTYRLSSEQNGANAAIDADNRYLWRMNRRRLDVEAWRDALLAVSGRLDRTIGGPSVDLASADNRRRTVYARISRHNLDSLLRLFDFPDANITSEKRTITTVPQQQLFVLNSPFMHIQAKALAARLQSQSASDDAERIHDAFQLAYGRAPTADETQLGLQFLGGQDDPGERDQNKLTRWERYAQVLLSANEFMYID